ncbi:hypothetical protein EB233_04335 [Mesorhizobium erdmanii]|uniref:Uncharacterized protein n=1 Tax=Mesorhizobium erdmanii TaxID=1777866 RepID=A0A6M7UDS3_9HYPH|nr:hypothetical protein EB233_04335 [Mesorhizobium erdmanii]
MSLTAISTTAPHFVILGRSKERSDAAQTLGSMPGLQRATTAQILLRCAIRLTSRNGSSGLRDAASRLLRPWMTTLGRPRPIVTACANPLKATMSAFDQPANRQTDSACNPGASA